MSTDSWIETQYMVVFIKLEYKKAASISRSSQFRAYIQPDCFVSCVYE